MFVMGLIRYLVLIIIRLECLEYKCLNYTVDHSSWYKDFMEHRCNEKLIKCLCLLLFENILSYLCGYFMMNISIEMLLYIIKYSGVSILIVLLMHSE